MTTPGSSSAVLPAALAGAGAASARWWPAWLAVAGFWLLVLNQQRLEWTVNPVYSYGWAVPALVVLLFAARWGDRPPPGRALPAAAFGAALVALLVAYLPVRVVQEANPDWVKINWAMAGLWAGAVLAGLARIGGAPYVRHFLFPVAFAFTALPWPVWVEDPLTKSLMQINAGFAAEILTLLGTPAAAVGNLIQVGGHWVNVEEACSGIRSLQTAFMVALFLGEFHRLGVRRRAALLLASFAVAFAVNLARTLVLTRLARADAVEAWHDTVGTIALLVCLAALWGVAELMRPRAAKAAPPRAPAPAPLRAPLGWRGALLACAWLAAAEGLTWGWYRAHERALPPPAAWDVRWPRTAPDFAAGEFSDRMRALLKFNRGATASWTVAGYRWQMYCLEWLPGRVSKFLSTAHYPTVCLPATGLTLVSETGVWHCRAGGVDFPFTTYLFAEGARDVYVFHAILEDRPAGAARPADYRQVSSTERLDSVWRGERNLGQRVVGIALRGPVSPEEARAAVADLLGTVIVPGLRSPPRTALLP
jgi:exosortase